MLNRRNPENVKPSTLTHRGPPPPGYAALIAYGASVCQTRSSELPTSGKETGSSSLLVIQVHGSKIATTEERVSDWKTLINQWRNEISLRD